ncbi:MAG: ComZ family protein [Candidatus Altiarchaeota archaeon]
MSDKPILEKTFNENLDIDGRLKEGAVLGRLFLEVQGNDREASETALKNMIFNRMGSEPNMDLLEVKMYELQEDKAKKFYSGVVEVRLLARDFRWFLNIVMRYGPSAIELIEPEGVTLNMDEMQSILADASEISQSLSTRILSMLKEDERAKAYKRLLDG